MRAIFLTVVLALGAVFAIAGCGSGGDSSSSTASAPAESLNKEPVVEVPAAEPPKQLETKELVEGTGAEAKAGDTITVQYVGVGYESEEKFDASWDRGEPFTFTLGAGEVIPGWDEGIVGMKEKGRRELIIPSELAYGPEGSPPAIGPNETLIFVVDLLAVK
jgi:peptidylprolyl isomerase